jgi:hypothetical protein
MYASHEYVSQVMTALTDKDLAKPTWFPLLNRRGFRSTEVALAFGTGHVWQHIEEARVRHGRAGTLVGSELTPVTLNGMVPGIPLYLIVPRTTLLIDARKAHELDFSFALSITSPGGGLWKFHVTDTDWQVGEVESADTDLVLSIDL